MGLLTKIAKGVGGFASSYGPLLTAQGAVKQKMDWMDLKASKLAEATLQSSQVEARRKGTELVLKEVGDQITSIEGTLGGQTGLNMTQEMRSVQTDRLKRLQDIRDQLSRAHLVDVGWPDSYIIDVLFPGQRKKKNGDEDDDGKDLGDKVKAAKQEGGDDWNILPEDFDLVEWWNKNFLGVEATDRGNALATTIENIAWKDDLLLNAIKGLPGVVAEDNFIRQIIADVLGNEPALADAQTQEDINNITADPGILKTIVGKIVEFVKDPLKRKEWSGEGPAPGEDPKFMESELKRDWDTGSDTSVPDVGWRDAPVPSGVDVAATDREQERILGTGEGLLAQHRQLDASEQPYQDYAPTVPAYDAGSLTEGTTEAAQTFAPPPMEEGEDANQAMVRALSQGVTEGTTEALQSADISDIKNFVSEIDSSIKEGSTEALEEMIGKDLRIMYQRSASKVSPEEYLLYLMSELRAAGIADHVPPGWVFKISTAASGTLKMGEGWFEENVLSD
jgi:hypothetical protein